MKPGKKAINKYDRRRKTHEYAMVEAKKKAGNSFNPGAWKVPGSRNQHKT